MLLSSQTEAATAGNQHADDADRDVRSEQEEEEAVDLSAVRWSRREEADFYKTMQSFGVEYDVESKSFEWSRFKTLAHIARKPNRAIAQYFKQFYKLCIETVEKAKGTAGTPLGAASGATALPSATPYAERMNSAINIALDDVEQVFQLAPLTVEKASRTLQRIELLARVRCRALKTPGLFEKLHELCQPNAELPEWWICGYTDFALLKGIAKYALFFLLLNHLIILCPNFTRSSAISHVRPAHRIHFFLSIYFYLLQIFIY